MYMYIQHKGVGREFQTYLETPKFLVLEQKSLHRSATLLLFLVNRRHNEILLVKAKMLYLLNILSNLVLIMIETMQILYFSKAPGSS